jgi:hypothetical protein
MYWDTFKPESEREEIPAEVLAELDAEIAELEQEEKLARSE